MGKKKGKQHEDGAGESAASAGASLADFLSFPGLDGMSDALPETSPETVPATAHPAPAGAPTPPKPLPRAPPENTLEDLEARHKKEKRELEGAARAAKKAAGKNKAKVEEAEAAAEQAMEQLRQVHESEVLGLELRDETGGDHTSCDAGEAGASRGDIAGIKEILTAPRPREPSAEELRIDPSDGQAYPLASFIEVYGEAEGQRLWAAALPSRASHPSPGMRANAPYIVMGSKKGGFPVTVESRARGKTVTVIHNVSGDVEALLTDLKGAVGAGGLVREGDVEVQGDHSSRIEAMLLKLGCIKGVSHTNIASALPAAKPAKAGKSIARLDKKAAQPSR